MNAPEWRALGGTSEEYLKAIKAACNTVADKYHSGEISFDDIGDETNRIKDSVLEKVKIGRVAE